MRARDVIDAATDIACGGGNTFGGIVLKGDDRGLVELGLRRLTAAGYRILGPNEVDPVTVEKAAQLIEANCLMNTTSGQELSPRMEGDMNGVVYAAAIRALGRKA